MERRYRFWLETDSGQLIVWRSLSERQAREMYNRTRAAHPEGVRLFGWNAHSTPMSSGCWSTYREQRAD